MQIALTLVVLRTIFSLSSDGLPISEVSVARRLGLKAGVLQRHLAALEHSGLIDGQRLRLTLSGLAVAVSMGTRSPAKRRSQRSVPRPIRIAA